CLRLVWHCARCAAARAFCMAGSSRPTRTAMIAITTRSSTRVKPGRAPLTRIVPIQSLLSGKQNTEESIHIRRSASEGRAHDTNATQQLYEGTIKFKQRSYDK